MLGSLYLVILLGDYQINCLFSNREPFVIQTATVIAACFNFIKHNVFAVRLFQTVCDDDDDDDVLVVLILRALQCTRRQ